jgi:hypothetical protein
MTYTPGDVAHLGLPRARGANDEHDTRANIVVEVGGG